MDNLPDEARQSVPKKPLNPYFKFRSAKIQEFKDCESKAIPLKQAWQKLDKGVKDQMQEVYQIELKEYKAKSEEWKAKFGISVEDIRPKRYADQQGNPFKQQKKGLSLAQTQKWQSFKQTGSSFMKKLVKQFEQKLKQFHHSQVRQKLATESNNLQDKCISAYEQMCFNLKDDLNVIIDATLNPDDFEQQ